MATLLVLLWLTSVAALDVANFPNPMVGLPGAGRRPHNQDDKLKKEMSQTAQAMQFAVREINKLKKEMSQTAQAMQFAVREITNRLDGLDHKMAALEEAQKQASLTPSPTLTPHTEHEHRHPHDKHEAEEEEEERKDTKDDDNEKDEKKLKGQIKACGRPPMTEGQKAEVTVWDGQILAVYSCGKGYALIDNDSNSTSYCKNKVWSPISATCNPLKTCGHLTSWRMEYNGTMSVTKSGKTCQSWTSIYPHRHDYTLDRDFWWTSGVGAETPAQASNYCRDPGMFGTVHQVWCYTTDPETRWEECNVPVCGK